MKKLLVILTVLGLLMAFATPVLLAQDGDEPRGGDAAGNSLFLPMLTQSGGQATTASTRAAQVDEEILFLGEY